MTPGHRESALRAAASADLLLVVVAADEPVLRSELDFVLDASERVGSVVFVMNRIDLNPDWDDMRREHRDRIWRAAQDRRAKQDADESNAGDLARQAERLDALGDAAMLPVSARLATRAATRGNTDLADRSGIEQVRELLADLGCAARRAARAQPGAVGRQLRAPPRDDPGDGGDRRNRVGRPHSGSPGGRSRRAQPGAERLCPVAKDGARRWSAAPGHCGSRGGETDRRPRAHLPRPPGRPLCQRAGGDGRDHR